MLGNLHCHFIYYAFCDDEVFTYIQSNQVSYKQNNCRIHDCEYKGSLVYLKSLMASASPPFLKFRHIKTY